MLTAVSVVPIEGYRSSDLVFCPLQNQWVKKNERSKPTLSISALCAPAGEKIRFLKKLVEAVDLSVADESSLENLFFGYQVQGDSAFAGFPSSPGTPDRQVVVIETFQTSSGTHRPIVVAAVTKVFALEQFSRPPTFKIPANFAQNSSPDNDPVSASIAPRAPPVSL